MKKKHREENPIETFIDDEYEYGKEFLDKYAPEAEKEIDSVVEELEDDTPDLR